MLALLSSPIRRWLFATLLLPVVAFALSRVGRYLQRRHGGVPTKTSRLFLAISERARRSSGDRHADDSRSEVSSAT